MEKPSGREKTQRTECLGNIYKRINRIILVDEGLPKGLPDHTYNGNTEVLHFFTHGDDSRHEVDSAPCLGP